MPLPVPCLQPADGSMPSVVLDTNTVLDWLLFGDPAALRLAQYIQAGSLQWRATTAMRREFEQVLLRPALTRWEPDAARAAAAWDRYAHVEDAEPPAGALRCLDPDDQVFIDFALHRHCNWLVTRDRALLRLARRALPWGVVVLTPQAWGTAPANLRVADERPARPKVS